MEHMKVYAFEDKILAISKGFNRWYLKGKIIHAVHGISPISSYSPFKLTNIKTEEDLKAHLLAQRLLGG
ncbi:MAG: hypothetical protein GY815_07385 [Gammaproteobacteria bacterium]|nr:hypothetical protein [Gammaproteobacteria bacterium]